VVAVSSRVELRDHLERGHGPLDVGGGTHGSTVSPATDSPTSGSEVTVCRVLGDQLGHRVP